MEQSLKNLICCFTLLIFILSVTSAQPITKFIFFPKENPPYELNYFAGLSMAQLPSIIVEDVFDQVPMIELKACCGLPYHFSARADLHTNALTNLVALAPAYSLTWKKLSISAGNEFLVWFGFFISDGFKVSVFGWGYSPFASIGYDFDDFLLSVKIEANIKSQNSYMRNLKYKDDAPKFTGVTASSAVEQPLWGDNYFAVGFRAYYTKFFYKSWLSFSTFNQYTYYSEFFAGFTF